MSSSSVGAWPHHSDSRCPRISASSARRNVYSTSGVSEIWIEAVAISVTHSLLRPHPEELAKQASRRMEAGSGFAAILQDAAKTPLLRMRAGFSSHMPDFVRHVVESRMPV